MEARNVAIVGATGLVGREMVRVLEESGLAVGEFIPVASERSAGTAVVFKDREYEVVTPEKAVAKKPATRKTTATKRTTATRTTTRRSTAAPTEAVAAAGRPAAASQATGDEA